MRERICTNAFNGYCLFLRLCYEMGSCQKRKAEEAEKKRKTYEAKAIYEKEKKERLQYEHELKFTKKMI